MKVVAFAAGLFGMGVANGFACAPPPEPNIVESMENAAAVAQYKALLGDCRKKGKAANSLAVYETCADEIDHDLCRRRSLRCDGGAK